MTLLKSSYPASLRQRLMASVASLASGPSPADWDPTETPSSIASSAGSLMTTYSMGRSWSVDAAVEASFKELPQVSPMGRVNRISHFGSSTRPDPTVGSRIGLSLLENLSEISTIPELDFCDIELLVISHLYGPFWRDALKEATRGLSLEAQEDYTRRANRLYGSNGCLRSSPSKTSKLG